MSVLAFRGMSVAFHVSSSVRGHEKTERPTVLPKTGFKQKQVRLEQTFLKAAIADGPKLGHEKF